MHKKYQFIFVLFFCTVGTPVALHAGWRDWPGIKQVCGAVSNLWARRSVQQQPDMHCDETANSETTTACTSRSEPRVGWFESMRRSWVQARASAYAWLFRKTYWAEALHIDGQTTIPTLGRWKYSCEQTVEQQTQLQKQKQRTFGDEGHNGGSSSSTTAMTCTRLSQQSVPLNMWTGNDEYDGDAYEQSGDGDRAIAEIPPSAADRWQAAQQIGVDKLPLLSQMLLARPDVNQRALVYYPTFNVDRVTLSNAARECFVGLSQADLDLLAKSVPFANRAGIYPCADLPQVVGRGETELNQTTQENDLLGYLRAKKVCFYLRDFRNKKTAVLYNATTGWQDLPTRLPVRYLDLAHRRWLAGDGSEVVNDNCVPFALQAVVQVPTDGTRARVCGARTWNAGAFLTTCPRF